MSNTGWFWKEWEEGIRSTLSLMALRNVGINGIQ